MKKLLSFSLLFCMLLTACSDDSAKDLPEVDSNKYITGVDFSKEYSLEKATPTFKDEPFHALGYGYDITGKFAHPESIRKKVIDTQKYEGNFSHRIVGHQGVFRHRGLGTIYGSKNEVKKQLLMKMKIESNDYAKEYKNAFRGVLDTPFENDKTFTDIEYYYAINAFTSSLYEYFFDLSDSETHLLSIKRYLTDEFKSDLETKSAKELISLYGTHVLVDIEIGMRQDYYYRTTLNEYLKRNMIRASDKYLHSTPGIFQSPFEGPINQKENIYTEYVNGFDEVGEANAWMIDITNYTENMKVRLPVYASAENNPILVNWGTDSGSSPIIPIYEFVSDGAKKEALIQAYKEYLSE